MNQEMMKPHANCLATPAPQLSNAHDGLGAFMSKHFQSNSESVEPSLENEVPFNSSFGETKIPEAVQTTTYKFRAECTADAQAIRAVLLPWLMEWAETRKNLTHEGVVHPMPDVVVEFSIVDDGPSYDEMLWLIDGIGNCHIAAETITTAENYTGERISRKEFDSPAKRPSKELLNRVLTAVKARQQALNLELERTLQLYRTYETAGRLGDKWQPYNPGEPSPGWLMVVGHKPTGLNSIRRISAPFGSKKWQKLGNEIVNGRFFTISA